MALPYVLFFGMLVVATSVHTVLAITDEERTAIRVAALPVLMECGKEVGVTKEQALKAKQMKDPDVLDPCFYACFFKKSGVIDDNGMYNADAIHEKHKKYIHDEEDLKKIEEMAKTCASVNDKTVGDGTKGCERAKLLVHCLLEHKSAVFRAHQMVYIDDTDYFYHGKVTEYELLFTAGIEDRKRSSTQFLF